MNFKNLVCLIGVSIILFSCTKKKNTDGGIYIINNTIPRNVNVRIYPTLNDYYNNSNVVVITSIAANGSTNVAISNFDTTKTYYIDYYTDDYSISNWFTGNGGVRMNNTILLKPRKNAAYNIENPTMGSSLIRKAYLNGDGIETRWSAFEVYEYDVNSASYIPVSGIDKEATLVLKRDFTSTFSRLGNNISYSVNPFNDDKSLKGVLYDNKGNLSGYFFSGAFNIAGVLQPEISLDTLVYTDWYDGTGYYYKMAKVK